MEGVLSKSTDDAKLGTMVDAPRNWAAICTDLNRQEKWADKNLRKFKDECKDLSLFWNNPTQQDTLSNGSKAALQSKTWVSWGQAEPATATCPHGKGSQILGCMSKSVPSRWKMMIIRLYSVLWNYIWELHIQFEAFRDKTDTDILSKSSRAAGVWSTWPIRRGWESQVCSAFREDQGGIPSLPSVSSWAGTGKGADSSWRCPANRQEAAVTNGKKRNSN